jgi:hypothetical protein
MTGQHIEDQERRCPRLGGTVISFSYCMISGNDDLPCLKILDCWWEEFDVQTYLEEQMTAPAYQRFISTVQRQQNKIGSIVEIANMARRQKLD